MDRYIVLKSPGESPVTKEHPEDIVSIETLRAGINKQWLEVRPTYIGGVYVDVWCDEEGLLHDLDINFWHPEVRQFIVGPVVVCGTDREGNSVPLTKDMADKTVEFLNKNASITE